MSTTIVLAAALLCGVAILAPQQLGVIVYKIALVVLAGVAGYYLDRGLFPYARPHKFDIDGLLIEATESEGEAQTTEAETTIVFDSSSDWIPFVAAQFRRALIVAAAMLAVGLGL
jgi:hypothetical protein